MRSDCKAVVFPLPSGPTTNQHVGLVERTDFAVSRGPSTLANMYLFWLNVISLSVWKPYLSVTFVFNFNVTDTDMAYNTNPYKKRS